MGDCVSWGAVAGILSAILLAFIIPSVWALVMGYTIEAAARCILSFIVRPFYPRFDFDRDNMRALLKFSRGMLGLPLLTFIFMNIDVFVIGKIMTMAELGLYSLAARIAWVPLQFMRELPESLIDFAFDLFWGKPVFMVMHNDYLRNGYETLTDCIVKFNSLSENLKWDSVGNIINKFTTKIAANDNIADIDLRGFGINGFNENMKILIRRYAFEFRDNFLCKNDVLLNLTTKNLITHSH